MLLIIENEKYKKYETYTWSGGLNHSLIIPERDKRLLEFPEEKFQGSSQIVNIFFFFKDGVSVLCDLSNI